MLFVIIALVIMFVVVAFIIKTVRASVCKKQKAKADAIKLAQIRYERKLKEEPITYPSIEKVSGDVVLVVTHKNHYHHKRYHMIDKEEVKPLVGVKRLVDKAGGTQVAANLYALDKWNDSFEESHYNVRKYKVDKRNARRNKRAMREAFYAEW